jgi:uncharacterized protein (TIGR02391 family)
MSNFPLLDDNQIERISQLLGDEITGSQLNQIFMNCNIIDNSGHSTKWRRIYHSLSLRQQQDKCGNNIADFIKSIVSPVRYLYNNSGFENLRRNLNSILLFKGIELNQEGNFYKVSEVKTIKEAQERAKIILNKLKDRNIHPEVLKFCNAELMQDNYFHAVFEATKSLAQRIREITGLNKDGAALVDEAFSIEKPYLVFNKLEKESEKSEHKGFTMLLKGCFSSIRNPLAHEPKILWNGEDDATDYLTLISLLHKKLDNIIVVKRFS